MEETSLCSKQGNSSSECDLEVGCVLKGNREAVIKDDEHAHLRKEPVWDVFLKKKRCN